LVKKSYTRYSQPQDAQSSQKRPRTRVYLMISMVWSSVYTSTHTSFLYRIRVFSTLRFCGYTCCFIKKSHLPPARIELA
jgi:hypothetical protein